jgi:hypothetical protein
MEKAIGRFRQLSLFIVIVIPFIFILYFIFPWGEFKSILPLPIFLRLQRILLPALAISSWIFFPALWVIKLPNPGYIPWLTIRAVVFSLGIPFCCIFSYAILLHIVPETIYNSAQLGSHNYHLTITVDDFVSYAVYKCNEKDLECEIIFDESGERSITSTALTVNQSLKVIDVYQNGQLIFSEKPEPYD